MERPAVTAKAQARMSLRYLCVGIVLTGFAANLFCNQEIIRRSSASENMRGQEIGDCGFACPV